MKSISARIRTLFCSAALIPMGFASIAHAQQQPDTRDAAAVDEVIVTGSRIISNGFSAPTPVTTLTADALFARTPTNVADALNQLPQFKDSASPATSNTQRSTTPNQGNFLNLRGLGSQRTLILLDGIRVPPTSYTGAVDVNTLPQVLMSKVDVVTGGASAAYGSDALVGVVNFVLDKRYNGIKGSIQTGISRYGDNESYRGTIAAGRNILGERGHIEGSLEYFFSGGIKGMADRPGGLDNYFYEGNGTAQYPYNLVKGAAYITQSFGGKINSGPLSDYTFLPDGRVVPFRHGTPLIAPSGTRLNSTGFELGGPDGASLVGTNVNSALQTANSFGRFDYEVTPDVNFHAQAAYSQSKSHLNGFADMHFSPGTTEITIFSDNAFLRPEVRAALGTTTSFKVGRISLDLPYKLAIIDTNSLNFNTGFDGTLGDWRWDVTYVHGYSHLETRNYEGYQPNFYAALDAVRDPATNNIVCRVALTNPGKFPGCVPLNIMGVGAPSQAASDYTFGWSNWEVTNKMDIVAANISGDLFELPAGMVSIAGGVEYRQNKLNLTSNSDPAVVPDVTGVRGLPSGWQTFNYNNVGIASGKVTVKEIYGELAVPLLKDLPLIQSLDLSTAVRVTDYSTSGRVETWKVGLNYQPFEDLRLRATQSRDIAAPSLFQLYSGTTALASSFTDIHTGSAGALNTQSSGNPNLTPEIGAMVVAGAVYSPSWLPGFQISVDGYQLLIRDAISQTNATTANNDCEVSNGLAPVCAFIIRPLPFSNRTAANFPSGLLVAPLNLSKTFQSGVDIEMAYKMPLSNVLADLGGELEFRLFVSNLRHIRTKQGPSVATVETAGSGTNAKWRGSFEVNYTNGPIRLRLAERMTGTTHISFTQFYAADDANKPNRTYTDLSGSYGFGLDRRYEGFFSIANLFNVKPPFQGTTTNPGMLLPVDKSFYDVVGTQFNVGLRFKY
jgi:outer membrane receptor protein involved in Fe transport